MKNQDIKKEANVPKQFLCFPIVTGTHTNSSVYSTLSVNEFPFVYNISNMFRLLGKAIIRLNNYKVQKYKCFIFLCLIIFQTADSCGKNPKYVNYCKEAEILSKILHQMMHKFFLKKVLKFTLKHLQYVYV